MLCGNEISVGECYVVTEENVSHDTFVFIGWGKISHSGDAVEILQQVEIPIAARSLCQVRNSFNFHAVTNRMICAGEDNGSDFQSACHGDSGGPLSCELSSGVWSVLGVVSWGSPLCNGLDRYTVFTRVSLYNDWIQRNSQVS